MRYKKQITMILVVLLLIGCGGEDSMSESSTDNSNLPTMTLLTKESGQFQKLTLTEEIDMIKNSIHELPWAYYQEERSTTDRSRRRWFTLNSSFPYVFSLMPIEESQAGWAEVSLTAGSVNLTNNTISIGDIPSKDSCEYYDWGLKKNSTNCIIQNDVENIKNSTVPILWWFFEASNGSWYIMQEGSSIAYMFAGNPETGDYDWSHAVDIGVEPTFFVENGVKKMKFEENVALTSTNTVLGIDLSDNNGGINWTEVISDGKIKFAFIKATEGYADDTFSESQAYDSQFSNNMYFVDKSDILMGAYHFARPTFNRGIEEAKKEADYFVSKISEYYYKNKMLPPVLDIEESDGYTPQELTDWILAFMQEVELKMGIRPMLYMNEDYWNNKVMNEQLSGYKLWIAKYLYDASDGIQIDTLEDIAQYMDGMEFRPTTDAWSFWQFSSTSFGGGISSIYHDRNAFNGTIEELESLLVQSTNQEYKLKSVYLYSPITAGDENVWISLNGKDLVNIDKVFIAGIEIDSIDYRGGYTLGVHFSYVHGGNLVYAVPFGYRDVTVKFLDGSTVTLTDGIFINETDLLISTYSETILQTKSIDSPYAKDLNAFYATSYGQDLLGQCTWYVYGRFVELVDKNFFPITVHDKLKNAFWSTSGRDAKNWSTLLGISGQGISTATIPLPSDKREKGLLAIWECGTDGHVGFVEEVGGDNKEWYILSDFNRGLNTSYRKQKYKFDSSQNIDGAVDDQVGGCYPTFYNLVDENW